MYLFPFGPSGEQSNDALRNSSAFGHNCGMIDELIRSELKDEERANKRGDAVCDDIAVGHVAAKLCTCKGDLHDLLISFTYRMSVQNEIASMNINSLRDISKASVFLASMSSQERAA